VRAHQGRDEADILVQFQKFKLVIEFDTIRADQVAKNFVSRAAILDKETSAYIAFCYPGTGHMNVAEVVKYLGFMCSLAEALNMKAGIGLVPSA
jgi:hypothetical protein